MGEVVVTGIGSVTPFGRGVDILWDSLLAGKNAITNLDENIYQGHIVKIGAPLPEIDWENGLNIDQEVIELKREDPSMRAFFCAAYEALEDANLDFRSSLNTRRIGVFIADRPISPVLNLDQLAPLLRQSIDKKGNINEKHLFTLIRRQKKIAPDKYVQSERVNHMVAKYFNIEGPHIIIGAACASSNTAIGEALYAILSGNLDIVITGGAYNFDFSGMIGFSRIGALTENSDPDTACKPFDLNRDGFVMGAGAGILVLESIESAKKRNCDLHCKVSGFGSYTDAYRPTDPDPSARASVKAIRCALEMANIEEDSIDYINAHGTSTKMNDYIETKAIKEVFGKKAFNIPISSTKSMMGHSIMAAAAIEGIVCIKSIKDNMAHVTRNYRNQDPYLDLDYVSDGPRSLSIQHTLSNSFGFGGVNTCLIFSSMH